MLGHLAQSNGGNLPLLVDGPPITQIKFYFYVFGVINLQSVKPKALEFYEAKSYLGAKPILTFYY